MNNQRFFRWLVCALALGASSLDAQIKVVTSTTDLADFVKAVGGERVHVDFIVRGDQNPHFVDVKPSYMMKLKSAHVFFIVGLELELWAPQIIDGSRNSRLLVVDLSKRINKLDIPVKADASQGDIHRFGNPHYWLDPRNVRLILEDIVTSLASIKPEDESLFRKNADDYLARLGSKISHWESVAKPFGKSKIITFHRSWTYFSDWLGLEVVDQVEPKPGIQPSPGHTSQLINKVRTGNIKAIIVEPFYDTSAPEQIARSTSAHVLRLATSVGGVEEARDYISMMDFNINTLVNALR